MARKLSGPDHLDAAHDCLDDLARARSAADWPRVSALAAAAQAHLAMASFAWQMTMPGAALAGRHGQRWLAASGLDQIR